MNTRNTITLAITIALICTSALLAMESQSKPASSQGKPSAQTSDLPILLKASNAAMQDIKHILDEADTSMDRFTTDRQTFSSHELAKKKEAALLLGTIIKKVKARSSTVVLLSPISPETKKLLEKEHELKMRVIDQIHHTLLEEIANLSADKVQ